MTNDKTRLMAIKELKDDEKALLLKILLSREEFKKYFFKEEDVRYSEIGLDKDITIGIEIESIGKKSEKILEAGESNGTIIHQDKDMICGKILKRRRTGR